MAGPPDPKRERIRQFYRMFDPYPLDDPAQRERLYVDLDPVRGDAHVARTLADRIDLSENYTVQLLAGHIGSGKSTELYRLKGMLEDGGWHVVFTDVAASGRDVDLSGRDADLSDLDFPDLLVMILRDLVESLKAPPLAIKLEPGYFRDLFRRFGDVLLSPVEVESIELNAGLVKLGAAVRTPETRKSLRTIIAGDAGSWLHAANDAFDKARTQLRKHARHNLAVIVDGLDKLVDARRERSGWRENLYKDRRPEMGGLRCHVVYTIPLDIVLTSRGQVIADLYNLSDLPVVPMVKVRERPPAEKPFAPGIEQLRAMVNKRLFVLNITDAEAFAPGVLDRLIAISGGQLRQLMQFIRDACPAGLPITMPTVEKLARAIRLNYSYWLGPPHWELIHQARTGGELVSTAQNAEPLSELIESRALLHYRNHGQWCGPNPLLPEPPPQTATPLPQTATPLPPPTPPPAP